MNVITSIAELESLYGETVQGALTKVQSAITPQYKRWINQSRFLILTTVGTEGTDASPRGDINNVVRIIDECTLWLPDWRGNNRIDSLRNIVSDGRISLLFMVPGSNNVVRINGTALLTVNASVTGTFEHGSKTPNSVIVETVQEVYFQCAKALMRSRLWNSEDESEMIPTAGEFLREVESDFNAENYDQEYPDYAKDRMW